MDPIEDVGLFLLSEAAGARPHIQSLAKALKKLQRDGSRAVCPKRSGEQNGLFYNLRDVRRQYKEALQGAKDNPFTIDDLRILTHFAGSCSSGPQDQALSEKTLGSIEYVGDRWRWTFKEIGSSIRGELHDTEGAAADDLARLRSKLFPLGCPLTECFDAVRRSAHIQRIKTSVETYREHRASFTG